MALITPPTAQEIYDRSRPLTPDHFTGTTTDDDVMAIISNEILPDIIQQVDMAADAAALPYDFPLTADLIQQAYPQRTIDQVNETVNAQNGAWAKAILYYALSELYDRVDTVSEFYTAQSLKYRGWADAQVKIASDSISAIMARTKQGEADGRSHFGLVQIKVAPHGICGELDMGYCNGEEI